LNPNIIKDKGRPKGALGKKKKLIHVVLGLGVDAIIDRTEAIVALLRPKTGLGSRRGRILGRGQGRGRGRGRGIISTRPSH
jgi:hypothetical protein